MPLTTRFKLPYLGVGDPPALHQATQVLAGAVESALSGVRDLLDAVKAQGDSTHAARLYGELAYQENKLQRGSFDVVQTTAITGLETSTVNVSEPRKVYAYAEGNATSDQVGTQIDFRIVRYDTNGVPGTGKIGGWRTVYIFKANNGAAWRISLRDVIPVGSSRFAVQFRRTGGPGGCFITADLAYISVDDKGPVT